MTSPGHTDLREELTALAETQTFSPDPSAWDRGRRARRRDRSVRVALAVAVVAAIVGAGAVAVQPDSETIQPAGEVRGGALPSRIDYLPGAFEDDWAIGRASVALGGNGLVLIGAEDGRSHHFAVVADVFALSPDGYRVAWWSGKDLNHDSIRIADLRTGEITDVADTAKSVSVASMTWAPDSGRLRWNGWGERGTAVAAWLDLNGSSERIDVERFGARGIPSPSSDIVALDSDGEVTSAPFEMPPTLETRPGVGYPLDRALPTDLYPDGAVVTPVGWADEDHVVAIIDPPPSEVVERPRLAVFTRPELRLAEWTFREFLPRLPPEATSFAVDLIPDLTGDPDQQLTRDFTADPADEPGWVSLVYGAAGVLAVLLGLFLLGTMGRRRE